MTDPEPAPATLRPRARLALALLWLGVLLVAGWAISRHLDLSGDLRRFMPSARTPEQRLLIDELGEGPGSRLLLVALSGADDETLAARSHALRESLGRGRDEDYADYYIRVKRDEWNRYHEQVTPWEIREYLTRF